MGNYLVFDLETEDMRPDVVGPAEIDIGKYGEIVAGRQETTRPEGFPKPHEWEVLCVGWAELDSRGTPQETGVLSRRELSEEDVVEAFLAKALGRPKPTFVTWNGRRFDFPVLVCRALHYGIGMGWYYKGRGLRYRYSTEGHIDVKDELSDFGAGSSMGLKDAAKLCGLAGKTINEAPIFKAADTDWPKVEHYCLNDVRITAQVFARWLHLRGEVQWTDVRGADARWAELVK